MRQIYFYKENNDFSELLKDQILKKHIKEKTSWYQHLCIGIDAKDEVYSYLTLKYGDNILSSVTKDYSPVMHIDYAPVRK